MACPNFNIILGLVLLEVSKSLVRFTIDSEVLNGLIGHVILYMRIDMFFYTMAVLRPHRISKDMADF